MLGRIPTLSGRVSSLHDADALLKKLGFLTEKIMDPDFALKLLRESNICHSPVKTSFDTLVDVAEDVLRGGLDEGMHVLVLKKRKNGKPLVFAIYEVDKSSKQAHLHVLCKCMDAAAMTPKYHSKSCAIKGLAAAVLYFIAFWCRDVEGCETLHLIAQSDGGQLHKLMKYYEKLGFVACGEASMFLPLDANTGLDASTGQATSVSANKSACRMPSRKFHNARSFARVSHGEDDDQ